MQLLIAILLVFGSPTKGACMTLDFHIERQSHSLRLPEGVDVDRVALLKAIARIESSGGARGKASKSEPHLRAAVQKVHPTEFSVWGDSLLCSHGAFQILGTTALELGMEMPPERLREPEIATFWAIEYLNRGLKRESKQIASLVSEEGQVKAIGDLYNSGRSTDDKKPLEYMANLWVFYQEFRGA